MTLYHQQDIKDDIFWLKNRIESNQPVKTVTLMIDLSHCSRVSVVHVSCRPPSRSWNLDGPCAEADAGQESHRWSPCCQTVPVQRRVFSCPQTDCGLPSPPGTETCSLWTCSSDPGFDFWTWSGTVVVISNPSRTFCRCRGPKCPLSRK